jgi:hypothetical protein
MTDLEHLQILAQLIDNMERVSNKLEDAYNKNNAENFEAAKKEILDIQKKIANMPKG